MYTIPMDPIWSKPPRRTGFTLPSPRGGDGTEISVALCVHQRQRAFCLAVLLDWQEKTVGVFVSQKFQIFQVRVK